MNTKPASLLIFLLLGVSAVTSLVALVYRLAGDQPIPEASIVKAWVEPVKPIFPYQRPEIPVKRSYLTFLVGDSMVAALGTNANQLRLDLIERYPDHEFVNYNYGFGSTNILTVPDRLSRQSSFLGQTFPPILEQTFDLIIFESFAYNPLSHLSLSEGLKKQTEILESAIKSVVAKQPKTVVAIMVPIAPSQEHFAKSVYKLSPEVRKQWVSERVAYIQNAVDFATINNIPLINVYEKSKAADGQADLRYINPSDYIHPSKEGIKLMSTVIADFIYENRIFPH